ncbi:uncharacterized protein LOC116774426 [Danaus plexippus]|uniref:uncharacterized protein LOC116774426 n=1 Tax=Danaus plexippus TaxID=13037 RepID=UPI002AAF84A2|nr:uncharacterized protein LOC116774426 [Danaus plexippus]XP_032523048.2 uncharacterized protein LOC116774426 [Danaus plexippus]XP_061380797.1 uncharacterized protein LOC116774426 [Danaus plexippus]XP_061380798.1 uncharacterized protein LOC116774426 [Danaus plexippus]
MRHVTNSRVRRRLFAEDVTEEARRDNTANVLLELIKMDQEKNTKKYNFDFKKEVPLEGAYEWSKVNGYFDWTGEKINTDIANVITDEKTSIDIREFNEATPRMKAEEQQPALRKRRRDSEYNLDNAVRRKIDF